MGWKNHEPYLVIEGQNTFLDLRQDNQVGIWIHSCWNISFESLQMDKISPKKSKHWVLDIQMLLSRVWGEICEEDWEATASKVEIKSGVPGVWELDVLME